MFSKANYLTVDCAVQCSEILSVMGNCVQSYLPSQSKQMNPIMRAISTNDKHTTELALTLYINSPLKPVLMTVIICSLVSNHGDLSCRAAPTLTSPQLVNYCNHVNIALNDKYSVELDGR